VVALKARRVVVVGYDRCELLDIACVTSALDVANRHGCTPPYEVILATQGGATIRCDSGLEVAAQARLEQVDPELDTLIVLGGLGHLEAAEDQQLRRHVRRLAQAARRVSSVCTGASVLAAAGLLDGRHATTHWMYATDLNARYPAVDVDAVPVYVRDGNVATSGGVTAALDLTLAFVAEDHGTELARRVAMALVTYLQRPGSQEQMSFYLRAPRSAHNTVSKVVTHIGGNLDGDLTPASLARVAGLSERHLGRLLTKHLEQSPGRLVRQARLDAAAQLLATTMMPVTKVAAATGFRSTEALRQAFTAEHGVPPMRYRANHGAGA
jgi:transcriptional regulator GlxA family with amidase domain